MHGTLLRGSKNYFVPSLGPLDSSGQRRLFAQAKSPQTFSACLAQFPEVTAGPMTDDEHADHVEFEHWRKPSFLLRQRRSFL